MSGHLERESGPGARLREGLATLRQAVAGGTDYDFTSGSIGKAVVLLAVPMMLELSLESVFAVADAWYISRLDNHHALATISVTEVVLTLLVFAAAIGLSMGTTAMVARRIGEGKREEANVTAVQAIGLGVLCSIALGVPGAYFAPEILSLMGGSAEVVEVGTQYTRIMMGGSITIFLLFLINAIFRGAGDASIAMKSLWLANAINLVLDPCLIFGWGPFPEMGLTGAAVATTIGRAVGVAYQLNRLFRGGGRIQLHLHHLKLVPPVMARLINVSIGGIGQFIISQASWVGVTRIVALFGSAALAGQAIAVRIILFTFLPAWGMSNAAATLVGQNLGAGKPERAEASVWKTGLYTMLFLVSVSVVFIAFPEWLVGLFTRDPEVLKIGSDCLRIFSYSYGVYAYGMVMIQSFNGAGDTKTPTWINFLCHWLLQIPLAYYLAKPMGYGPQGVFWGIVISEVFWATTAILVFRRGKWKTRQV